MELLFVRLNLMVLNNDLGKRSWLGDIASCNIYCFLYYFRELRSGSSNSSLYILRLFCCL